MKIELRPFERSDFARLISWVPDQDFLIQFGGPNFKKFPLDEVQLEDYLQGSLQDPPLCKIYKGVDLESGNVVGHIEIGNINWIHHVGSICRVLAGPDYRGKGVGEAMTRLACRIAFKELGLHRLQLSVYDFNIPAFECYKKVGFKVEGLMRENVISSTGSYWNTYIMSILESEYTGW